MSVVRSALLVLNVSALLGLISIGPLLAQGFRRPSGDDFRRMQEQQMRAAMPQLEARGTVEGMVSPNVFKISTDSKQIWYLRFSPETRVEITGKAKPDVLQPGVTVSLVATVNVRTGRVDDKVGKLTIFVPTMTIPLGALPEQEAAAAFAAAAAKAEGPGKPGAAVPRAGGKPVEPAGPPPDGIPPARENGGRGGAKARLKSTSEFFDIKGRITGVKGDTIQLYVPNPYFKPAMKIEVADDVEVDVAMEGTATQCSPIIRPGDTIEARGRQVAQNGGDIQELKITLVEPLSTAVPTGKRGRGKAAAQGKKTDGPEEPKDEPDKSGKSDKGKDGADAKPNEKPKDEANPASEDQPPAKTKGRTKKARSGDEKPGKSSEQ